jgi:hypothetical protein
MKWKGGEGGCKVEVHKLSILIISFWIDFNFLVQQKTV